MVSLDDPASLNSSFNTSHDDAEADATSMFRQRADELDHPGYSPGAEKRGHNMETQAADQSTAPHIMNNGSPTIAGDSSPMPLSRARQVLLATTLTLAMLMSVAGMQAVTIGLPSISQDLHMKETDLEWILSAYSLTNGCLLLLSGRFADVYGRKRVLLTGMAWYAIWSLAGGFMQNGAGLVTSRAMAGCGAAMAVPSATGIIAHTFTGRARAYAYALFSAGAPLGGALGLIIGGLFVAYVKYSWRSALFFLAGLATLVVILTYLLVPNDSSHTDDPRIDWLGAALVTSGLVLLQFAISDGQGAPNGWKTSYIIALLIVGPVLIAAFFFWERHVIDKTTRPPLMRLQLFTRAKGRLSAMYFIGFVAWMGFHSLFYHATLYFQEVQQTGALGAMIRFLPTEISGLVCNCILALVIHRVPTQWLVCCGLLSTGFGNMCLALSERYTNYWAKPFHGMWLSAAGADFFFAPGMIFISALSLPDEQSVAAALFQTLIQLGGSFGISITSLLGYIQQNKALTAGMDVIDARLVGLQAAFWLGASMSFLAAVVALVASAGTGRLGMDKTGEDQGGQGGDEAGSEKDRSRDLSDQQERA